LDERKKGTEMIEVTEAYFHRVIHNLNVHFTAHEKHGEWKLNGQALIARTEPGFSNNYVDGVRQKRRYFVIKEYANS
jgi:hypothetical protein